MALVIAPEKNWTTVSPQSTCVVMMVPSGSVAFIDSVMVWLVYAVDGDGVTLTTGGLSQSPKNKRPLYRRDRSYLSHRR